MEIKKSLSYEDVKKMVHETARMEEWYERVVKLLTDDEFFLRDILDGASEDEIERYFEEFPEMRQFWK